MEYYIVKKITSKTDLDVFFNYNLSSKNRYTKLKNKFLFQKEKKIIEVKFNTSGTYIFEILSNESFDCCIEILDFFKETLTKNKKNYFKNFSSGNFVAILINDEVKLLDMKEKKIKPMTNDFINELNINKYLKYKVVDSLSIENIKRAISLDKDLNLYFESVDKDEFIYRNKKSYEKELNKTPDFEIVEGNINNFFYNKEYENTNYCAFETMQKNLNVNFTAEDYRKNIKKIKIKDGTEVYIERISSYGSATKIIINEYNTLKHYTLKTENSGIDIGKYNSKFYFYLLLEMNKNNLENVEEVVENLQYCTTANFKQILEMNIDEYGYYPKDTSVEDLKEFYTFKKKYKNMKIYIYKNDCYLIRPKQFGYFLFEQEINEEILQKEHDFLMLSIKL